MKIFTLILFHLLVSLKIITAQATYESDIIKTSGGDLKMTFIGHGTLMFEYNDVVIHIDPVSRYAKYSAMPKADIILITHHHSDHLDLDAIKKIKKKGTVILCSESCIEDLASGEIMKNGDTKEVLNITVKAVPAYNLVHKRKDGDPYHPKGVGNGYIISFGDTKVYVAGDTENFPEMQEFKDIDIAFLPMNIPYTMTPEMVVDAVKLFNPKILYPYHYGNTDVNELQELLKDKGDCEVRIRKLK